MGNLSAEPVIISQYQSNSTLKPTNSSPSSPENKIELSTDINSKDSNGYSSLHHAIFRACQFNRQTKNNKKINPHYAEIKKLVEQGADVEQRCWGQPPLHLTLWFEEWVECVADSMIYDIPRYGADLKAAELLLELGAKPDSVGLSKSAICSIKGLGSNSPRVDLSGTCLFSGVKAQKMFKKRIDSGKASTRSLVSKLSVFSWQMLKEGHWEKSVFRDLLKKYSAPTQKFTN